MRSVFLALALVLAPGAAFAQKGDNVEDQVISYRDSDTRMNSAIEQARALLPLFLDEFRRASTQAREAFTVKAGLRTSEGGREHIWIGDLRYDGDQLVGNLINEPYDLPGLRLGSRVEIELEDISDWSIRTPQGTYGGFTTRVMLEDMAPSEAQRYRTALSLANDPTPPGWTQ